MILEEPRYLEYCKANGQTYFGKVMWASQGLPLRHAHMQHLLKDKLARERPSSFHLLEVGSWAGGSVLTWAEALKNSQQRSATIVCVDGWKPFTLAGARPDVPLYQQMGQALTQDTIFGLFWHNVRAAGHDDIVVPMRGFSQQVLPLLADDSFDLAFIDGNHTYNHVLADLRAATRLVREGGILCGDDLELQSFQIDLAHAETQTESDYIKDPRTEQHYHPGVTLAVGQLFGRVQTWAGFWAVQKCNGRWKPVDLPPLESPESKIPQHLHPPSQDQHCSYAAWLARTGATDNAINILVECINAAPQASDPYLKLAAILEESQQIPQAEAVLLQGLRLVRNREPLIEWLVRRSLRDNSVHTLLALHPFLMSLQHDNFNLLTPVGEQLYQSGHVNEAEALWRRKTSVPLSTDDAFNNLAVLEAGRGNHDQAFAYLKQALTINPENEAARTNQAALLEKIGTAAREVRTSLRNGRAAFAI